MNLALPPQIQGLIDERVRSGKYQTAEDVVAAAIASLDQQERYGDFLQEEVDSLIEQGESGGDSLDGEEVLAELRKLRSDSQSNPR
jgi:putative addiction module CopG family antidote